MTPFFTAWQMIREQKKRAKQLRMLQGDILHGGILQQLVNEAAHGVVISLTFKDGAKADIRREDAFDRLNKGRESW